jgi:hypothetical protein
MKDGYDMISVVRGLVGVEQHFKNSGNASTAEMVAAARAYVECLHEKTTRRTNLKFGEALDLIQRQPGMLAMRLKFWMTDHMVFAQVPDENSKMNSPYLYLRNRHECVPWTPSFPDMFSSNWEVIGIEAEEENQ